MKIVLIGGHLSPALSVIDEISKETKILFIGRKYVFEGDKALSLEYKVIKSLNVLFAEINTGRFQRKFTRHTIFSLFKITYGFFQAFFILRLFKPDVVVGFGGYVSVPVVLCAYLLKIPVVIHEQTLEAGLANKFLSGFATKICISWNSSRKYFSKEKTVLTGNPIRGLKSQGLRFGVKNKDGLPVIYITGGSSGSHFINVLVEGCLKNLLEEFVIIHQTGDSQQYKDFDRLQNFKNSLALEFQNRYILKKFVDFKDVGSVYKKSDLVISRAGINTISELIFFGKPSLLIPLAFAQSNEQVKNANYLKNLGLGEVLEQEGLNPKLFLQKVGYMIHNIRQYRNNSNSIKIIDINAAHKIMEVIEYVAKKKKE